MKQTKMEPEAIEYSFRLSIHHTGQTNSSDQQMLLYVFIQLPKAQGEINRKNLFTIQTFGSTQVSIKCQIKKIKITQIKR